MRGRWSFEDTSPGAVSPRRTPRMAFAAFALTAILAGTSTAAYSQKLHLDHWANGGNPKATPGWVDGNLHWTNSTYAEGDSVPTRFVIENLPNGTTHTLTFQYTTTKKQAQITKHAHDYVTTYNAFIAKNNVSVVSPLSPPNYPDPCLPLVQGNGKFSAGCTTGPLSVAIPADTYVTSDHGFTGTLLAERNFKLWNVSSGSAVFGGIVFGTPPKNSGAPAGRLYTDTTKTSYSITFTVSGALGSGSQNVVIAMGGHLSVDGQWSGDNNGAQDINGAPYHWEYNLVSKDGAKEAQGNRDRSIMIMQKGSIEVHKHCVSKDLPPGIEKHFPFHANQPPGLVDGLPSPFSRDCDQSDGATIVGVTGAFSLTEDPDPDQEYDLASVSCKRNLADGSEADVNGFDAAAALASGTANFNFAASDHVVCHFNNHKKGSIKLVKDLVPSNDPGLFNLIVDGKTCATAIGDGGSCDTLKVKGDTDHILSEAAGNASTFLADYTKSIACVDQTGATVAVDQTGKVHVEPGANLVCTITNTFANPDNGTLIVIKHVNNGFLGQGTTAADFQITVQGKANTAGVDCAGTTYHVNEGLFAVGEIANPNYTLSRPGSLDRSYCGAPNNTPIASDCSSGSVTVPRRGAAVCVLVNDDNRVSVGTGRMTGGGNTDILAGPGGRVKVTQGFELHCGTGNTGTNPPVPNNLQINWPNGNKFHMDVLQTAFCYMQPNISPAPPAAGFNTMVGHGIGTLNGVPGATVDFTFVDAGEPGTSDQILIKINNGTIVSGTLGGGNFQAH